MAQNNLTATIQQLDSVGATLARRVTTYSDIAPSVGDFTAGLLTVLTEVTITLPIAQARQVMIHNTHATAKITVKWTPNGGAKATIIILQPGDMIAFWSPLTGATNGISLLTLTSDTLNATYESFVGG